MARLRRLAEVLGLNAVPVAGVYAAEWSWATVLAIYWWETLVGSLFVAVRLWLHARWRDPAAVPDVVAESSFAPRRAGAFLAMAVPFTLAHGLMLAAIFGIALRQTPDADHLRQAALAVLALQAVGLGFDLWSLHAWPVGRVNELADYASGRIVFVQLTTLVGLFTVAALGRPETFFAFFAGVKTISDITRTLVPRVDQGSPDRPPAWLGAIMKRVPPRNGETFEARWRRTNRGAPARPSSEAPPPAMRKPANGTTRRGRRY
jgi:hypothetical protein